MYSFAEESDWNSIVMECKSLSAKWEKLSIYLGLPPDKIDTIKRDNHDAENRWSQALLAWIRQGYETKKYGKPSWRTLLRAIAEENKHLFDKLSQSHLSKPTMMYNIIPYTQKFSPGENFRQFRHLLSLAKFLSHEFFVLC